MLSISVSATAVAKERVDEGEDVGIALEFHGDEVPQVNTSLVDKLFGFKKAKEDLALKRPIRASLQQSEDWRRFLLLSVSDSLNGMLEM